ncbi:MAG: lipoprotein [Bacilli bacterium]
MKKIIIAMSAVLLTFTLVGCSKGEDKSEEKPQETSKEIEDINFEGYKLKSDHVFVKVDAIKLEEVINNKEDAYIFFGRST